MAMMQDDNDRRRVVDGMTRAFAHAIDMNRDGQLDAHELDEFRKYLIARSIDGLTTEEYVGARRSGRLEELREAAAPGYDDERHFKDVDRDRDQIARRITASFIGKLYDGSYIDDATYAAEMEKIGGIPDNVKASRESPESMERYVRSRRGESNDEDEGAALVEALNVRYPELAAEHPFEVADVDGVAPGQSEGGSMQIDPAFVAAWKKRDAKRRAAR